MSDQHKEIAENLGHLVDDGFAIYFSAQISSWENAAERKQLEKKAKERDENRKKKAKAGTPSPLLVLDLIKENDFGRQYQRWYSQAMRVVEQLLPDRYLEFRDLYRLEKRPKALDVTTYTISDYIHGTVVPSAGLDVAQIHSVAIGKLKDQIDILASARDRLKSILGDIEGSVEAVLLDDELATARELLRTKHLRSAGVVAGVVLERHLKAVASAHKVGLGRKKAQIGSLNDALKEARVFDNPRWREVQRLGDIRNLCAHDGDRLPNPAEVRELIEGAERIVKTVF